MRPISEIVTAIKFVSVSCTTTPKLRVRISSLPPIKPIFFFFFFFVVCSPGHRVKDRSVSHMHIESPTVLKKINDSINLKCLSVRHGFVPTNTMNILLEKFRYIKQKLNAL